VLLELIELVHGPRLERILRPAGAVPAAAAMSTAVLPDQPMPARLAPWPRAHATTLTRCVVLALLLHLAALLWLGNAPEGTAPPGAGVQGRLNVTLRGPLEDGTPAAPLPQAGPADTAAATPARIGGQVRDTPVPPEAEPGAARLGEAPPPLAPALPALRPLPAPLALPEPMPEALPQPAPPLPVLAPLPLPAPAPVEERRLDAPALRQIVPSPAPALPAAPATVAAQPAPALAPLPELAPVPAAVAASPAPGPVLPNPGAAPPPDTGPRVGADVAVPATAASAPRPLNLQLGRLRGGELSRHGTMGVLPALPRPPESNQLAKEIEDAARADCRRAHAAAGLLAVVPLAVDTVRGAGCKW
jgi:hypothetical protein